MNEIELRQLRLLCRRLSKEVEHLLASITMAYLTMRAKGQDLPPQAEALAIVQLVVALDQLRQKQDALELVRKRTTELQRKLVTEAIARKEIPASALVTIKGDDGRLAFASCGWGDWS